MSSLKNEIPSSSSSSSSSSDSDHDMKWQTSDSQARTTIGRTLHRVHLARLALTLVALAAGIAILGTSADSLATYRTTHLAPGFFLQLWPEGLDLRPTTALVAGSGFVILASVVSLAGVKARSHQRSLLHIIASLAAPAVGFIAALVAMSLFYAANTSSATDTLQSWTCRWELVPMAVAPHWSTLCKQTRASVALSVVLVPLEALILGLAGWQVVLEKRAHMAARGDNFKA